MSVIAISAWSHCQGGEIAERAARKLGYAAVGPELINEAASRWDTPPPKFAAALGRQDSLLGVTPRERRRLLAYLEAATLARLARDKAVTWGLGAHLYVMGISHVLKVRLVRDGQSRVGARVEQSGLSPAAAAKALKREDEARARVAREVWRQHEDDPTLYDLTINLTQIDPAQAVEIIAESAQHKRFRLMTFSRKLMGDQVLAAQVRAAVIARHPEAQVAADGGHVRITVPAARRDQDKRVAAVRDLVQDIEGIVSLRVEVINDYLAEAAQSMR